MRITSHQQPHARGTPGDTAPPAGPDLSGWGAFLTTDAARVLSILSAAAITYTGAVRRGEEKLKTSKGWQ